MIKVEHTKTHTTGQHPKFCDVLVTDAKLVLVPCVVGIKGLGVVVDGNHYHSILISETEKIEVGDWLYDTDNGIVLIEHKYQLSNINVFKKDCHKILALPEHFSPEQLQMIVDGKLKDGDKILIECRQSGLIDIQFTSIDNASHNDGIIINVIKLNPHITIYPVIEEKMYTKDEVKKLISKAFSSDLINSQSASELDKWIEQNVK